MKYLSICLTIIMISCGGNSQKQSENKTTSDNSNDRSETSCLADITDPAQWYSLSEVAALVSLQKENIKQKANERFNSLQYSWDSGRKHMMKISNNEMEVPTRNVIGISNDY